MTQKPYVLYVGKDAVLNHTRRLILERCCEVCVADSVARAKSQLSEQSFAVVLLCYTLADEECNSLVTWIQDLPLETRILLLGQLRDGIHLRGCDGTFPSGGPAKLVERAAAMAGMGPEDVKDCLADEPARKTA